MSAFPKMVLTNAGIVLQTKIQSGITLEFTRIGLGDGNLNGQPISPLTKLINQKASVPINDKKIINSNTLQVSGFFSNQDIQTGFYWREFGVFANDPDSGEILYAYSNAGNAGDYIPTIADQRIEKYIYASFAVQNAENVNVTIPQSDTFIPSKEKGVANGVASLDSSGKVPETQLPELDFIKNSEKGVAGGVATLGEDGKLKAEQAPEMNFYSKTEILQDNTKTLFGLDVSALPDAVFNKIKTLIDSANSIANGKANCYYGFYYGTGTYGVNSQNKLNFPSTPKFILVQFVEFDFLRILIASKGVKSIGEGTEFSGRKNYFTWGEDYVSWYSEDDASTQYNISQREYRYFVIC